jgi:hypothetical protein
MDELVLLRRRWLVSAHAHKEIAVVDAAFTLVHQDK